MYFERTNKGTIFDIDNQRLEEEEDIYIYIFYVNGGRNIFSRNNKKKKEKERKLWNNIVCRFSKRVFIFYLVHKMFFFSYIYFFIS